MMETNFPYRLQHLSTLTPPSSARAWQSAPHPHQPFIATACADKTVRIYSLTSFTLLSTITGGHKRSVRTCAWKPSLPTSKDTPGSGESILATGSFDASAAIWIGRPSGGDDKEEHQRTAEDGDEDEEDFRFAVVLEGHDSEIKSIAWSVHGTFLATCSRDKSVWIWEALDPVPGAAGGGVAFAGADDEDNYETVAVMQEHDGDVKTLAWHPTEEQCLVSGSYDEQVRVWREDIEGEWGCVACCEGHTGTVWCVDWEPWGKVGDDGDIEIKSDSSEPESGPRIISCSDDLTIRLWKRTPKARPARSTGPRIPSIIRSTSDEEDWSAAGKLPQRHERSIYAIAWSKTSKRVVSCGSDGKIVVYQEQPAVEIHEDSHMINGEAENSDPNTTGAKPTSEWEVLAEIESAHGVFEINHVCWAQRFDRNKRDGKEEVIISTGDDGEVKIWTMETI